MSSLPEHVTALDDGTFQFRCHPQIRCFNECCRELELSLTPYDVINLCNALDISSDVFLEQYGIVEFTEEDLYPKVYLTMVDDGRATCPFVGKDGCKVYQQRPSACRSYPIGRGVFCDEEGRKQRRYVLLKEAHCHGFSEDQTHTADSWQKDQGLTTYNSQNDLLLPLLHHPQFQQGERLSNKQADLFVLALYNLDVFKKDFPLAENNDIVKQDLLPKIILWLQNELFKVS